MVQPRAGQGAVQIALRLPVGLRDRIKRGAEQHGRSMNSEIVDALERAFPEPPNLEEIAEDIRRHVQILRQMRQPVALHNLADSLDDLMVQLALSGQLPDEQADIAARFIEDHYKGGRPAPAKKRGK